MKRKKLVGAFLSPLLFVGVLADCSSSNETTSGDRKGNSGDTIKIGANLELSGGQASFGQSVAEGLELAVEEINKEGVLNGKQTFKTKVNP